jgi:hypothetical protein
MKLKLKETPEQVELVRALGSRNPAISTEANEAFAAFIGPVVSKVLNEAGTSSAIYTDTVFDEDDNPSYPLDLYYNTDKGFISVWSQDVAGGLPSSNAMVPIQELKLMTYRLDSAVHLHKRYARKARLDVVAKAIERMAQEVLIKQERNAWAVIMKALAEGATKNGRSCAVGTASSLRHVLTSRNTGATAEFRLSDLNDLLTRVKRVNVGFAGGTPAGLLGRGLTDLWMSPEVMAQVRAFAFNAIRSDSGATATNAQNLPDAARMGVWSSAGMSEIYGVALHELIELGLSERYNALFETYFDAAGVAATNLDGSTNSISNFATASHQVLVGLDLGREAFIRPVARQAESGGTFSALPDDQFYATRADKTGWYGFLEEGRVCLDARALVGLILG